MQKQEAFKKTIDSLENEIMQLFPVTFEYEEKKEFWNQLYVPRKDEADEFINFVSDHNSSWLLLTGPVGSGKTTYVQDKIRNRAFIKDQRPLCNVVRVDFLKKSDDLRNAITEAQQQKINHNLIQNQPQDTQDETQKKKIELDLIENHLFEFLNELISFEILAQLKEHFKILRKNKKEESELVFNDVSKRADAFDLEEVTILENAIFESDSCIDVAAAVLVTQPTTDDRAIIKNTIKKLNDNEIQPTIPNLFFGIRSYLKENKIDIKEYIKITHHETNPRLVNFWIKVYSRFFNIQTILFLDNGDALLNALGYHSLIAKYANETSHSIFSKEFKDEIPPKVILALRDENVHYSNTAASRARKPRVISLSLVAYGKENEFYSKTLPIDMKEMGILLTKRIEICEKRIVNDKLFSREVINEFFHFKYLMTILWINSYFDSGFKLKVSERVDLVNIVNGSIRLALEMAIKTTFSVRREIFKREIGKTFILTPIFRVGIKGKIIDWFFNDIAGKEIESMILDELKMVGEEKLFCCTHRIILTYLYNLSIDEGYEIRKISFQDLVFSLKTVIDDVDHIKKVLFFLFKPIKYQREFITIEQFGNLDIADDIADNALIYINQRGIVLIRRIMQTIEYWAILSGDRKGILLNYNFYFNPETVNYLIQVLQDIQKLISSLVHSHERNWKRMVWNQDTGVPIVESEYPFNWYKTRFSIGNTFYLERVIDSHYFSIVKYLLNYTLSVLKFKWEENNPNNFVAEFIRNLIAFLYNEDKNVNLLETQKTVLISIDEFKDHVKGEQTILTFQTISDLLIRYKVSKNRLLEMKEKTKGELRE